MTEPDGSEPLDHKSLIKRLAPDQMAVFEPLSGLTLLNISDARWQLALGNLRASACTADDVALIRAIDHEFCHFAQFSASGYCFDRQRRAFLLFNQDDTPPETAEDIEWRQMVASARADAGGDPDALRRIDWVELLRARHARITRLDQQSAPGDHSVMGPTKKAFFEHLREVEVREAIANANGLSVLGLLEGAAVVYGVTQVADVGTLGAELEAELANLPPVYHELHGFTAREAGDRTLDLLLPTAALALHYARPNDAYPALLAAMLANTAVPAVEFGQTIATALPTIAAAGDILGTSIDQRHSGGDYRLYDRMLEGLSSGRWGVGPYDLLARPEAMYKIGPFPLGMATTDGLHFGGAGMEGGEMGARLVVSSAVLRVHGRDRAHHDLTNDLTVWGKDFASRLFSDPAGDGSSPQPEGKPGDRS